MPQGILVLSIKLCCQTNDNINIAGMQVGRKEIGGKAVMMLSVDAPVPDQTLQKITEIEGVLGVKYINL